MRHIRYEQSKDEFYTSNAGLGVAGYALKRFGQLDKLLRRIPLRHGISHKDLLTSYLGLLLLGKNDFDAIHAMRDDTFFKSALGIKRVPSAESLRLRKDGLAFMPAVRAATANFLHRSKVPVSALETGHVPLDIANIFGCPIYFARQRDLHACANDAPPVSPRALPLFQSAARFARRFCLWRQ